MWVRNPLDFTSDASTVRQALPAFTTANVNFALEPRRGRKPFHQQCRRYPRARRRRPSSNLGTLYQSVITQTRTVGVTVTRKVLICLQVNGGAVFDAAAAMHPIDRRSILILDCRQLQRLKAAFPIGVCNYTRPGIGQEVTRTVWQQF